MNVGPRFENLSKLISELIERNTQADSQRAEWSELMTSTGHHWASIGSSDLT